MPTVILGPGDGQAYRGNDSVFVFLGGQGGGASFRFGVHTINTPENFTLQIRVVDTEDPIQSYAEFAQMLGFECAENGRSWIGGIQFLGGDPFGLINREVTVTATIAFELNGQMVVESSSHTGLVEVP
jgi:hypothetical protein